MCKISGPNSRKRRGHLHLKGFGVLCLNQPVRNVNLASRLKSLVSCAHTSNINICDVSCVMILIFLCSYLTVSSVSCFMITMRRTYEARLKPHPTVVCTMSCGEKQNNADVTRRNSKITQSSLPYTLRIPSSVDQRYADQLAPH